MAGLSRKRKKTWRRKLAGFLAVCMMATSIQSTAFATASGEYEASSEEVVLDLSMEYMKEAIKESIEYGIHYSGDMAFSDAEGKASKYEEFLSGENVFELVSIPYADTVLYDAMPDDTSLRIFVRADEGQLKKMEQEASEAELKATDDALFAPEYEILGSEELIFLFTNGSDVDYSFKLNVDGHFTPAIKVPSGETLGYEVASESEAEEETEEETTAEETTAEEETAEGVGPSGETGGTVTDGGAGFGGGSGNGSGSSSGSSEIVDDADNQTDGTTTTDDSNKNDGTGSEEGSSEGSVTAPEEGNGSGNVTTPDEGNTENGSSENVNSGSDTSNEQGSAEGGQTDNSTTNSGDQTSEGTDGSGSVSDNGAASDNGASSDNGTVSDNGTSSEKKEEVKETKVEIVRPEKNNDSESAKSDDSGSKSSSDDKGSSDSGNDSADSDDGEQSASIVSYNIPRVTATMDGTEETNVHVGPNTSNDGGYVDDNTDWDDWFSADDDEDEYYSEDSSNVADSSSVVESGTILEPVFVKTESQAKGFARFALFAAPASSTTQTAVVYANTIMSFEESGNVFVPKVDLYDYYDVNNGSYDTANDSRGFNGQVPSGGFLLYAKGTRDNRGKWNQTGLYQGLAVSSYENADTQRPGLTKSLGNHTTLFPNTDEYIKTNAVGEKKDSAFNNGIRWYPNVDFPFFTEDSSDGYTRYSFDSNNTKIRRTDDNNNLNLTQISNGTSGFWPFNTAENLTNTTKEYAFGMHMSIPFYLPANGCFDAEGTAPLVFNFRGDDDVWVYLKDEKTQKADLILDIGGIHGATEGSVNFKTKTSTVSGGNGISFDFEGGREYTLEFFFIERNPVESNCKIEIGLPVIPNSGITIGKQVQGKSESIPKDVTYSFEVYSSNDLNALKRAYTGDVDPENVNIIKTIQGLNAGETKHAEFPSGDTYFFVKEVDNKKAETSWIVSGGAEEVQGATDGLVSSGACTKIYTIPEASESGVLMYCTNTFGTMKPTINKSAWKDFDATEDGIYDIALEVTGSEFESTTISGGAANVVFVLDNSGSMGTDGYKQATDAVGELMSKLPEDSYASVIVFNGKNIKDVKTPKYYYDECIGSNTEYYYDTIADWTYLKTGIDDLKTKLNGSSTGSGTHSAAGFLGAIHKLRSIPDTAKENPTYVLYMTDGEPQQDIERDGTTNKKVTSTSARIVAQNILLQLDNEFPSVNVYTIAFKYDTTDKWLENSTGVDKFYNAADIDELKKTFEDITKEIKSKIPLKNVNVVDQFSTAVQPYSDTPERYMDVWLSTEVIDKTQVGDDGKLVLDLYKTPLTEIPVSENEIIIGYNYVDASNNVIATFSLSDSTLRWAVADQLLAASTRTLIYRVKAVEPENGTLVKADKTSDTGTHYHDDELGYHSNVQATVTYDGGSQTFDHPVVVPANPDGSITITKKVENENTDYKGQKFNFELKLDNVSSKAVVYGIVSEEDGEEKIDPSGVVKNGDVYTFQLANNESFKVIGLNKEVTYTVVEQDYDDGVYYSKLDNITAAPNSAKDLAIDKAARKVTGTLTDTATGTKTIYFYKEYTSENEFTDNISVDEEGKNGWYDPDGNYVGGADKEIGGSIPRNEEDIYEYTWNADDGTEIASAQGESNAKVVAGTTVTQWLEQQGYSNIIVDPSNYKVTGKVITVEEFETQQSWWLYDATWHYDDSAVEKKISDAIQAGATIEITELRRYGFLDTDRDVKVTITTENTENIIPAKIFVDKTYSWEYGSTKYDLSNVNALLNSLKDDGYTVIQSDNGTIIYSKDVPMTDEELYAAGYTYREYGSRTEDVAPSNKPLHMEVEYTNTFYKRESIVVEKVIETDPGITVPDESYTFEIQDKNGTVFTAYELDFDDSLTGKVTRSEDKKRFTIQGAGEVKILLDKNLTGEKVELKVKEVSSGTADSMQWNDRNEGEPISKIVEAAVDSGGKVICTNYYFNNTLKITKKLDSASDVTLEEANAKGIKFKYVVCFTGDIEAVSYDGSIEGMVFDSSNEVNTESGTIALSNKTLTFMMPAERSLQLVKIPTGVTYTVKEEKLVNAYYEDLVSAHAATPSDMSYAEATRTYSGSFSDVTTVTKNQEVGYTNKVIRSKGELKIKKNLNKADTENLVFTFEIYEKMNPNKKFYASVPVSAGKVTSEITLEVPTGDYVVRELKTLRYTVDKTSEETTVTSSVGGSVEFTNTKGGNGYFSSVSTKVNTVNEDGQGSGFPLKNDRNYNSQNALMNVLAWLGSDNKENGDE